MTTYVRPFILSGGAGSRLWPLSRRGLPKQYHTLFGTSSLLTASLQRLTPMTGTAAPPSVICQAGHADLALAALDEAGFPNGRVFLEPEGRNTAAAAVLACLQACKDDEDAVVALMPADHHIARPDKLIAAMTDAMPAAAAGAMVVFGVQPDRPETGYGYIERGAPADVGFSIARFVEKPDAKTARTYLDNGRYVWNAGIFLLHARSFLTELAVIRPDILLPVSKAFATARRQGRLTIPATGPWMESASTSIDYAYAEKTTSGIVVPVDIGWSDVGSWNALHALADTDDADNAHGGGGRGDDTVVLESGSSYIHARQGARFVALVGVENIVVVDTPDALLVMRRDRSGLMRELARLLSDKRPDLL